jgi:hypothetical protein
MVAPVSPRSLSDARCHAADEPAQRLSRREGLLAQIRTFNPTASRDYLARFDDESLRLYLDHLQMTIEPRTAAWSRPGDTPAVIFAEPRDD